MDHTDNNVLDIDSAWVFRVLNNFHDKFSFKCRCATLLQQNGAFWTQLSGFPYWPARYCSEWELRQLIRTSPESKLEWAKAKHAVPVYFLKTLEL